MVKSFLKFWRSRYYYVFLGAIIVVSSGYYLFSFLKLPDYSRVTCTLPQGIFKKADCEYRIPIDSEIILASYREDQTLIYLVLEESI